MNDLFIDGRKVLVFNVVDDCNQEATAIEVGINYPEFISKTFVNWCKKNFIEIK